ncbi:MAG: FAD:protein FMN transferase [Alphaproteobacteria bacterium]|nr:FAD:protein FMN transferase [Alphaproteobacteria bacterium]MBU2085206.1 FAD:protein FMN transferase [Alphaproteobacteria bacterium]MBU2142136.1 FAD:protein FMN transferase [Alphaproteobacteria bacterium]MBU2197028.1 FAD:protein FMN transferase [Alphaproteobacteria bacterium]
MINLLIPRDIPQPRLAVPGPALQPLRLGGSTMGTDWSVSCHAPYGINTPDVRAAAEAVFAKIIQQMSTWEPTSLISQFNRLPLGGKIELPDAFREVLDIALQVAAMTDGALNPCLGAETSRLGFGPTASLPAPTDTPRDAWRTLVTHSRAITRHADFQLDLSAIAKGHSVDLLAAALRGLGITSFLAEIGGEFVAGDPKPDGLPWWVDIETPAQATPWRIALCGQAIATSGDYRRMRIENGQRITHITPHPGATPGGGDLASVSVVHPACAMADAWATSLFASGPKTGLDLANENGIAALFQFRDQAPQASNTLKPLQN